jgi:hypothetical protein
MNTPICREVGTTMAKQKRGRSRDSRFTYEKLGELEFVEGTGTGETLIKLGELDADATSEPAAQRKARSISGT